jgi:phosphopantetheine adenylyltransferase
MKLKISLMPFQFQKEMVSIWLLTQKSKTNISSKTVRKESVWHQK